MSTNKTSNPLNVSGLRVGVVYWDKQGSIISGISLALKYLGCEVINFPYAAKLPENLNVVFVCGPFGSLVPLVNQLVACPESERPSLVYIMTEQLPNPDLPEWLRYAGGLMRSWLERLAFQQQAQGDWRFHPQLSWLAAKGHRFRYYGDLYWLRREGLLSVLAIPSRWTAGFLRTRGFDPMVLPPSVNQGEDLELERDIAVLWIGKPGTTRRARLLKRLRADLRERGVELLTIDGVEHPYVFGQERTILLNRTKVIVNILREKWDDNSMRYVLAAPCRTLVITEPTLPHSFFEPGVHLVETPFEKMADTICYYLTHEEERQQIVKRAYQLVTEQSGLEKINQILERVLASRPNCVPRPG